MQSSNKDINIYLIGGVKKYWAYNVTIDVSIHYQYIDTISVPSFLPYIDEVPLLV